MPQILKALAIAALMIGNGMAQSANLISESASQSIFIVLLTMSALIITSGRRACAPCSLFNRGGRT